MVQRVILSSTAIRVSKAGYDAETAAVQNCLLDVGFRSQQILAHDFLPLTNTSGSPGYGPWEGSRSIGPYGVAPDVVVAFVFAGSKQLNPPRVEVTGRGSSPYGLRELIATENTLSAKVFAIGALANGFVAPELIGLTYTIFRRGVLS